MLGAPHEQKISTSVFKKEELIFQVQIAFQLRFRSVEGGCNWSQNIRVPQSQTFDQFFFVFQLCSAGKNWVFTLCDAAGVGPPSSGARCSGQD